jgi:hypothetical protein
MGYSNVQLEELYNARWKAWAPDLIEDINRKIWDIFRNDVPVTFLSPRVLTHVAHRQIQGLSSMTQANPIMNIMNLWIDEN